MGFICHGASNHALAALPLIPEDTTLKVSTPTSILGLRFLSIKWLIFYHCYGVLQRPCPYKYFSVRSCRCRCITHGDAWASVSMLTRGRMPWINHPVPDGSLPHLSLSLLLAITRRGFIRLRCFAIAFILATLALSRLSVLIISGAFESFQCL